VDNIGTLTPLDGEPPAIGGVLIRAPSFCPHGRGNASCGFTSRSKRGFPPASRFDSGHGMLHLCGMLWRLRAFPDFCEPCLPSQVERPPSGRAWVHEIKHDGFRLLARRRAERVRLFTRNGHDWSERFPLIVEALYELKATTCLLDGEAITCTEAGLAEFEGLRSRRGDVHFCAFDLLDFLARQLYANNGSLPDRLSRCALPLPQQIERETAADSRYRDHDVGTIGKLLSFDCSDEPTV